MGGFCGAMSNRGDPLTVYVAGKAHLVIAKKPGELICTQDPGHDRGHAACDGQGHILARWPRSPGERYWQHGDCEHCEHCDHDLGLRHTGACITCRYDLPDYDRH